MAERVTTPWLDAVRQVVAAVSASDVLELELRGAEYTVRVRREPGVGFVVAAPPSVGALDAAADADLHTVAAPFTGVFYHSPTPAARPYVAPGDWVEADAVIGLVETMKIFNEVTADLPGRITRFAADNGQLVHAGDPLVLIEPGARAPAESEDSSQR